MSNIKQVIVIRKDLNMRKGKMVAQGAHASTNVFFNELMETTPFELRMELNNLEVAEWLKDRRTKVCVGVNSETELWDIYNKAEDAKLPCSIVLDAGITEFKEPTYTAVAIGPAKSEEIDKITGELKLL